MSSDRFHTVPDGAALYFHVPFCEAVCDFCAFAKSVPSPGDWALFREGFAAEWNSLTFEGLVASTFWGGGTPGLLKAADIVRFAEPFRRVLRDGAEWTVELTPRCPTREKLAAWREAGVNRLSMGVQSFSPRLLRAMGRPHEVDQVPATVGKIRRAGFANLNIDLIIAYPGQTVEELEEDVRGVLALEPEHVSVYCLTLEEDTALYARLIRDGVGVDPEGEADLYERAWERLGEGGYRQYEISNFARPGFECAHHLNVWTMGQWRGIGPSAASQLRGLRFRNPHELPLWHRDVTAGGTDGFEDVVHLSEAEMIREEIVFGLRMNRGVPASALSRLEERGRRWVGDLFARLGGEGRMVLEENRYRLTLSGRMVADEISRWILGQLFLARGDSGR